MRVRLYGLLPTEHSARQVTKELLLARIEDKHIHFLARDSTKLTGLHSANLLQASDIVHAAQSGLIYGGVLGVLLALVAGWYLQDTISQWELMSTALPVIGALFGAWVSSMIGSSIRNTRLKSFWPAIDHGQILLMVDVPRTRSKEILSILQNEHPEVRMKGMEPSVPAFP